MIEDAEEVGRATTQAAHVFFMHVPRAAGATFEDVLRENFADGVHVLGHAYKPRGGFDRSAINGLDDSVAEARDAHVLVGRLPFAVLDRLPQDSLAVTFLRDPVERTLSQYYHALRTKPFALADDRSLEATLAAGNHLFDNLQTRMLSNSTDPTAEVDKRMLDEAKENLLSLAGFGLAERFDESLFLLAEPLGLESFLYRQQRVSERPRGADVPAETARAAEHFNQYDLELYYFAADVFEKRVVQHGTSIHIEAAALHAALDGETIAQPVDIATDELWALLVQARADSMREELARASAAADEATRTRTALADIRRQVETLRRKESFETADPEPPPVVAAAADAAIDDRATFFDAAETHTDLLSTQVGPARFIVRTEDKDRGRSLYLEQGRDDLKLLQRCVMTVAGLLGHDAIDGRVLVDVGANIGSTAIVGLSAGPFARAVALEPDPGNFEILKLNVILNSLEGRTTAIRTAVSDADGQLTLENESSRSVRVVTLDSLVEKEVFDPADVGLLWLDAEHLQGRVLKGATELTGRGVPIVFKWRDEGDDRTLILDALAGRYSHFIDMRATRVAGEPNYRIRPIDELADYVRPGDEEHITDILVLRLSRDQVPDDVDLLAVLRARGTR